MRKLKKKGDVMKDRRLYWKIGLIFILIIFIVGMLLGKVYFSKDKGLINKGDYKAIAYVTIPASENWRWIGEVDEKSGVVTSEVDVDYITHIHFAFGMLEAYQFENEQTGEPLKEEGIVSKEAYKNPEDNKYHYRATLNGWIEEMDTTVEGGKYLEALVKLKAKKPDLKVLLSIGGWDSDGFCYMAQTKEGRKEFIESCIELIKTYKLDGIDVDWEYPTNGGWHAIAVCKTCVEDGRLLLQEMRQAFDKAFPEEHKLLAIASGASQPWVDAKTFEVLDYINVMCYDYKPGSGGSQASLSYAREGMGAHLSLVGDTPKNRAKLHLGVPFYNEGGPYLVPYYKNWNGYIDASPQITKKKMKWVKNKGYGGAFYWAYSMDVFEEDVENPKDERVKSLQRTLYETLNGKVNK